MSQIVLTVMSKHPFPSPFSLKHRNLSVTFIWATFVFLSHKCQRVTHQSTQVLFTVCRNYSIGREEERNAWNSSTVGQLDEPIKDRVIVCASFFSSVSSVWLAIDHCRLLTENNELAMNGMPSSVFRAAEIF